MKLGMHFTTDTATYKRKELTCPVIPVIKATFLRTPSEPFPFTLLSNADVAIYGYWFYYKYSNILGMFGNVRRSYARNVKRATSRPTPQNALR